MPILPMLIQVAGPIDDRPRIARPAAAAACAAPDPDPEGDVVVCGRAGDSRYRLRRQAAMPGDPPLPPMTMRLPGGGTINLSAA